MTSTRRIEKELRKAEPNPKGDDAVITLGRNSNGTLEQVELGKIKHLLVGGLSGAGKTCLFQHIIEDLTSQGVEVYCVDAKRVGYLNFKGREHFHLFTSMEKVAPLLQALVNQQEVRYQQMEAHNTDQCDAGRIVLLIDEGAEVFENCSANEKNQIRRLLSLGRQCGIYVILGTQMPSRRIFSGAVVDLFPSRLALKCGTINASRVILDRAGAENLPLYGGMWLDPTGILTRIQLLPPINSDGCDTLQISDTLVGLDED